MLWERHLAAILSSYFGSPWWIAVVEAVVEGLQRQPEILHIPPDRLRRLPFDQDAFKETRDGRHVVFPEAETGDFDRPDAQPARAIPVRGLVIGKQVLVGDAGQRMEPRPGTTGKDNAFHARDATAGPDPGTRNKCATTRFGGFVSRGKSERRRRGPDPD